MRPSPTADGRRPPAAGGAGRGAPRRLGRVSLTTSLTAARLLGCGAAAARRRAARMRGQMYALCQAAPCSVLLRPAPSCAVLRRSALQRAAACRGRGRALHACIGRAARRLEVVGGGASPARRRPAGGRAHRFLVENDGAECPRLRPSACPLPACALPPPSSGLITYYPSASPLLSAGRPVGRSGRPVSRVKHTRRVGRLCGSSRSPRPGFNRCGGTRWNTVAKISGVTNGKSLVITLGALRMRWRHNPTTPCRASANGGPSMWGPHYTYPCRPVPKRSPLENQESGADRAGTLAAAVDRRRSGTGEP